MRTGILSFLIAALTLSMAPAAAGGGNWINFEDKYNLPGSEIYVSAAFYEAAGKTTTTEPLYLYATHVQSWSERWTLPDVSDPDVYRIGQMQLDRFDTPGPYGFAATVSGTFAVPDLPRGRYLLSVCDITCAHDVGAISTTGDWWIVDSAGEARSREQLDAVRNRFVQYRYRDERQDRRAYKEFIADLKEQARGEDRLLTSLDDTRTQLAAARAKTQDALSERTVALIALAVVALLSFLTAIGAVLRSRRRARARRRSATVVADSGSPSPSAGKSVV